MSLRHILISAAAKLYSSGGGGGGLPTATSNNAIFGYGNSGSSSTMTNIISNAGNIYLDNTGVGTARYGLAAAGYGGNKAIFGYGYTGTNQSMTNLVSNLGIVSNDVTGVGTIRRYLAAGTYGTDKVIFGFGTGATNQSMTNLVSNTGVVALDSSGLGTPRNALAGATYGTDKVIFGYGYTTTYVSMTNLISNTGVVANDVTGVGTIRYGLAAATYGGDKVIFGYGNNGADVAMTNLVSNTGVVANDVTGVGSIRYTLAAASYGGDKAVFAFGYNNVSTQPVATRNYISNTGVVSGDSLNVGTSRYGVAGAGYNYVTSNYIGNLYIDHIYGEPTYTTNAYTYISNDATNNLSTIGLLGTSTVGVVIYNQDTSIQKAAYYALGATGVINQSLMYNGNIYIIVKVLATSITHFIKFNYSTSGAMTLVWAVTLPSTSRLYALALAGTNILVFGYDTGTTQPIILTVAASLNTAPTTLTGVTVSGIAGGTNLEIDSSNNYYLTEQYNLLKVNNATNTAVWNLTNGTTTTNLLTTDTNGNSFIQFNAVATGTSITSLTIAKISTAGAVVWSASYVPPPTSTNYYVAQGSYVDANGDLYISVSENAGSSKAIIKINGTTGTIIWTQVISAVYSATTYYFNAYGITVGTNGAVYVTGTGENFPSTTSSAIVILDTNFPVTGSYTDSIGGVWTIANLATLRYYAYTFGTAPVLTTTGLPTVTSGYSVSVTNSAATTGALSYPNNALCVI